MSETHLNPFPHLVVSKHADSIYYGDLFKISEKIWMITGNGKSAAGLIASHYDQNADIARDCVGIIREGNTLYGYYDPGAMNKTVDRGNLHTLHKIDFIVYCLTREQSTMMYPPQLSPIDHKLLATQLSESKYPAAFAKYFFTEEKYCWLQNSQRRFEHFLTLTNNIDHVQFLLVPWMDSVEEKAFLYKTYR